MHFRYLIFIFIAWALVFSCKKEDLPANNEIDNVDNGSGKSYNVDKAKMLQLINSVRQAGYKCGNTIMPAVATVAWNDKLAKAAYDHSLDMKTNNYFSHSGLNGSNPGTRISAAGYSWKAYGENIAEGYTSEKAVVNGWLNSEGHCKNIMSPLFKEMGVGREANYWTQEFGSR